MPPTVNAGLTSQTPAQSLSQLGHLGLEVFDAARQSSLRTFISLIVPRLRRLCGHVTATLLFDGDTDRHADPPDPRMSAFQDP